MKYVFSKDGVMEVSEYWEANTDASLFTQDFEELENGKYLYLTEEQIEFYESHRFYDLYHLFYMLPLNEEEQRLEDEKMNKEIEIIRGEEYKEIADPLYMGYVKNQALGNNEKAEDYYNKWLEAIREIKEQHPYIITV